MNRPPHYPDYTEPGEPRWRRWWLALLLLWGLQSAALLMLWPKEQPPLELWLWNAVLPLCWALILALRTLLWQIGLLDRDAYRRTLELADECWWRQRSRGLPVEQVVVLGPAGDDQLLYHDLMTNTAMPEPVMPAGATQPMLRCPLSLSVTTPRAPALARHLARLTLAFPEITERWPQLRAVAWAGDADSQSEFIAALVREGVVLPETRLALGDLHDLDELIDAFHHDCPDEADWLLCAGVVSVEYVEEGTPAGEAGFVWLVSRNGRQLLHRSEYLLAGESPVELCGQMQRYAGLAGSPAKCLALDKTSQDAFVAGGWSATEHQMTGYWGVLAHLGPFIGMSLALVQAGESGQPIGWLSQDDDKRLAMGVAVPYGN